MSIDSSGTTLCRSTPISLEIAHAPSAMSTPESLCASRDNWDTDPDTGSESEDSDDSDDCGMCDIVWDTNPPPPPALPTLTKTSPDQALEDVINAINHLCVQIKNRVIKEQQVEPATETCGPKRRRRRRTVRPQMNNPDQRCAASRTQKRKRTQTVSMQSNK